MEGSCASTGGLRADLGSSWTGHVGFFGSASSIQQPTNLFTNKIRFIFSNSKWYFDLLTQNCSDGGIFLCSRGSQRCCRIHFYVFRVCLIIENYLFVDGFSSSFFSFVFLAFLWEYSDKGSNLCRSLETRILWTGEKDQKADSLRNLWNEPKWFIFRSRRRLARALLIDYRKKGRKLLFDKRPRILFYRA